MTADDVTDTFVGDEHVVQLTFDLVARRVERAAARGGKVQQRGNRLTDGLLSVIDSAAMPRASKLNE
jgi:hypothetical protein